MKRIFKIPCTKARDKAFFCTLEFDDYQFPADHYMIVADGPRLWNRIKIDDPGLIAHASRQFRSTRLEDCTQYNAPEYPFRTGLYIFNEHAGKSAPLTTLDIARNIARGQLHCTPKRRDPEKPQLSLRDGKAENLILIKKLALPYLPVIIQATSAHQFGKLRREIGSSIPMHQIEYTKPLQYAGRSFALH